jgi:hypothetical protein
MRPLIAAVLVLLAVPASAGAVIVPQKSIRGIALGMTVAEVRAAAGSPSSFRTERDEVLGRTRVWRYGLTTVRFDSTRSAARVLGVTTTSRRERTAAGVGVGSTRSAVRTKVPAVRCLVEFDYDHCFVGRWRAGEVVTDFAIGTRGRVTRVVVGRIVD